MISLDAFLSQFEDQSKIEVLSDNGAGAEKIRNYDNESGYLDDDPLLSQENQSYIRLLIFEGLLILSKQEKLIVILELIVKNGKNRQKSITELSIKHRIPRSSAERKYYRGG